MKTSIEVLERMGEVVVHSRTQYGPSPNEVAEVTLVLDDEAAHDLCAKVSAILSKRAEPAVKITKQKPERWWRVDSRAKNRTAYGRGRTADEGHRNSSLAHLHPGEVFVSAKPLDFEPGKGE